MVDEGTSIHGIEAILFDMDGTIVDSEVLTDRCVDRLLGELGVPGRDLDHQSLHGMTWPRVAEELRRLEPTLEGQEIAHRLRERFHRSFVEDDPPFIPGAGAALREALKRFPTAIVTTSNRECLEHLAARMGLRDILEHSVSAEDFEKSKPDPESYRLAAKRLGVEPARCLAFEDSRAGLGAAKGAGMWTVAISRQWADTKGSETLADLIVDDFTDLPESFFESIR